MPASLQDQYNELQISQGVARGARTAGASEDPLIAQLMLLLFTYAVNVRASDVHVEPTSRGARFRYRIDGMLHEVLQVPPETRDLVIRALKVKANMATDMTGRSKPQDGRIEFEVNGAKLDLRLSSFPTLFGDVLAIRVLDRSATRLTLEQLGFSQETRKMFERVIHKPNGLFLVTGPTNSGKTTTLYAALEVLKSARIKIVTLEDPVEYLLDGIDQAQINPQASLTFVTGLRAILRQDTNIILVGEIRDKETAEIAIRASLTGHLVLSTLHTRHACGTISRLLDMDIEPYFIVTSLTGVLAQRLIRTICPDCRQPDPTAAQIFTRLWAQQTSAPAPDPATGHLSRGAGCTACNKMGYRGRTGLFELLVMSDDLKQLVLDQAASSQLYKAAVASGMRTMLLDGLEKAFRGMTTLEEVLRVIGEPEDV